MSHFIHLHLARGGTSTAAVWTYTENITIKTHIYITQLIKLTCMSSEDERYCAKHSDTFFKKVTQALFFFVLMAMCLNQFCPEKTAGEYTQCIKVLLRPHGEKKLSLCFTLSFTIKLLILYSKAHLLCYLPNKSAGPFPLIKSVDSTRPAFKVITDPFDIVQTVACN